MQNRHQLAREGLFYPEHTIGSNQISGGHSSLAIALMDHETKKAKKIFNTWYRQATKKGKTLFLSSEAFFNLPEAMRFLLDGKKVLILAYHRSMLEYHQSVHNQLIKRHFEKESFSSYVERVISASRSSNSMIHRSFLSLYQEWEGLVGRENMIVRSYHRSLHEGSIEKDLLERLQLNSDAFTFEKRRINISYTQPALELKRMINHILDKGDPENGRIDAYLQHYSEIQMKDHHYLKPSVDEKVSKKLHEYYQNDELYIHKHYIENPLDKKSIGHTLPVKSEDPEKSETLQKEVLAHLVKERRIARHLYQKTLYRLQNGQADYMVFKLAEYLDIEHLDTYGIHKIWFQPEQIQNMIEGKYEEADYLRDIAVLLDQRGDTKAALKIISRARTLRPSGPLIAELYARIKDKL